MYPNDDIKSNSQSTDKNFILRITILLLLLIIVSSGSYLIVTKQSPSMVFAKISTPSKILSAKDDEKVSPYAGLPIFPLPDGKQVYKFTHGAQVKGPKPSSITIDPLTPKVGETQNISIEVKYISPIKDVEITLVSDYLVTKYPLTLSSGTTSNGVWSTTLVNNDTLDHRYSIRPTITSQVDKYDTAMWFRSPLQ